MNKLSVILLFGSVIFGVITSFAETTPTQISEDFKSKLSKASEDFGKRSTQEYIGALKNLLSQAGSGAEKNEVHKRLGSAYVLQHSKLKDDNPVQAEKCLKDSVVHYNKFFESTTDNEQWLTTLTPAALATSLEAESEGKDGSYEACLYILSKIEKAHVLTDEEENTRILEARQRASDLNSGLSQIPSIFDPGKLEITKAQYFKTLKWASDFAQASSEYFTEKGRNRLANSIANKQLLNDFLEITK